jgi:hypothetical protein
MMKTRGADYKNTGPTHRRGSQTRGYRSVEGTEYNG